MSVPTDIIEKIKKLLRLSRSSNRHEAELALARALELARQHAIAIDTLNPDDAVREKQTTHRDTAAEARLSYDKRYALAIVRHFFRVSTVEVQCLREWRGRQRFGVKVIFVGTRSEIEISIYVFGFLVAHFARCWRKVQGKFRNRQAFVHGMYLGVWSKLEELRESEPKGMELVLAGHDAYIQATIGETEKKEVNHAPDHKARGAAWAGFLEGKNTQLHGALRPAAADAPLALT